MAHKHYKGTGRVHSFRGLLTDGEQRKISIQGSVGAIAWRIVKMATIGSTYGASNQQSVVKVYREEQDATTSTIDFGDENLLAVGVTSSEAGVQNVPQSVIFDNTLFVRNLYVTHVENVAALLCNYYIELEEVKVSAAGMAQLAVAAARRREER